ncbi:hypothetical protein A3B56_01455 [Candidatus Roizmanbacteria bacterium RIFCSPLOWO2_01_FULL_45_11]|uniref:GIY-YIG domain-containing protein n=1 Tax=Candidatus Roizmanbacteria bacterium RIFCSPLOWO2_01_FULL_45_11 TaxID=1802070 RepID=A0A1F7JGC3_9BACT|nr:MAG: hypothetical protein A3B56_01455 [Candidatus Roizmanbacteria bacterium RIFCSPLOWO2_01_FULL_45_11]
MFYVYALKSKLNGNIYIGYSKDLRVRFARHNNGNVRSTKAYVPWKLIYYEAYRNKTDAAKREVQLKQHKAKSDLIVQIRNSLEEGVE